MGTRAAISVVQLAAKSAGLGQRTDPELLADFLDRRDPAAFEALVRRHGPLVLSACRQVLRDEAAAEDAFQATFVALYQKAASIRRRPSVGGWLFQVARRTALRARRAADRRVRHEARIVAKPQAGADLSLREGVAILHEELDRLPETYRNALILCYLEGLPRDEAAHRLGWTLNELRGRLERGPDAASRADSRSAASTLSAGLLAAIGVTAVPTRAWSRPRSAGLRVRRPASPSSLPHSVWSEFKVVIRPGHRRGAWCSGSASPAEIPRPGRSRRKSAAGPRHAKVAGPKRSLPARSRVAFSIRTASPRPGPRSGSSSPWIKAREIARTDADGNFRLPADRNEPRESSPNPNG